jgi:hypothetical protein
MPDEYDMEYEIMRSGKYEYEVKKSIRRKEM